MNLSMSMIESRLSASHKEVDIADISDYQRVIRGVRFLTEGQRGQSREYVYIGQASDFFDDQRYAQTLLLSSGRNNIMCRGSSYEDLLNDVIGAFDFFNDAEMRLLSLASKRAPLASMLEVVSEMIDDTLVVFGIDGSVLGGINEDRLPQNAEFLETIRQGRLQASTIGGYFKTKDGSILHDLSDTPSFSTNTDGSFAVCMYLYEDDEAVGFVMCFPQTRSKAALAESLEPVIAPYLVQSSEFVSFSSPNQSRRRALEGLLAGVRASERVEARILETLGNPHMVKVVVAGSLSVQNPTQRLLLMNEIESSGIACMSCGVEDRVAFLVSSDASNALVQQVANRFDKKSLAVGVSMEAFGLANVHFAYKQALFALQESDEPGVRDCRDLALPFLLDTIRREPAAQNLLHPALATLRAYDSESGTELLPTLAAYIECGCSQSRTAKQLFVHLNTLKYRLKRIVELTGIDFEDRETMLYLDLSLHLQ